jgi:lipopolysaccharide transport system ATP-binding protein
MNYAVRCAEISKTYRIGGPVRRYRTLAETIAGWVPGLYAGRDARPTFSALESVSFEVPPGEIFGVIGRNGAGKTTLLKILSGVTKPSRGEAVIAGRIGSMLEVGTGFHPELTGRENVFLNGTILGMRRGEILAKFDEIVAFAELEQFIDTPVKRYSSGMNLRLGFAVAAHLDTDVLLVDEVLAVGDSGFQQRCMEKMRGLTRSGRTILFVSHNMAAVENLCGRCLVLDGGRIGMIGPAGEAIRHYLEARQARAWSPLGDRLDRSGEGRLRFHDCLFESDEGKRLDGATLGQPLQIHLVAHNHAGEPVRDVAVAIMIYSNNGQLVTTLWTDYAQRRFDCVDKETHLYCRIPRVSLAPGRYSLRLGMTAGNRAEDWIDDGAHLLVVAGDYFGAGLLVRTEKQGLMLTEHEWSSR